MADPIVVSQLMAKRSELAGLVEAKRQELNTLLRDLAHIDAAIRIFDPSKALELLPVKRRRPRDEVFARNELMRRTLEALRKAERPLTAREIAAQIALDKRLETDRRSMALLTKRVVDALKRQEDRLENKIDGRQRLWWIPG
jgi:hypothetical protein